MITRRETLQRMAEGGAVAFAATIPGARALAQALPVRREISSLALNDPIVQTLRDGVRLLKNRPAGQGPTWADLAAIHGSSGGFNKCPHGNWYFLPWHRAYLLMYERIIRGITGNNSFAMPYWNWAANRGVPAAFSSATYNGQANPLYVSGRNNSYSVPDNISGPAVMSSIFSQTNYELFGSSRPQGQNSLAESWIRAGGTQATLEANPHNNIHINLGGFMTNGSSPNDPIFLMHHGIIDNIWWQWNCRGRTNPSNSLWRDMPFTNNFYKPDGTLTTFKPSQLTSISTLGYSYGSCPAAAAAPASSMRVLADARLAQIFETGSATAARPAGAEVLVLENQTSGEAVDASAVTPSSGLRQSLDNLASGRAPSREIRASGQTSQIVALIHNLMPPNDFVQVLVFAGTAELPRTADTRDARFVTTIGFFGSHAHGHSGVSVAVDLTDHLRKAKVQTDTVRVRLVARAVGEARGAGREAVAATVAQARIEVVIV